jgi:hypothetical protein
VIRIVCWKWVPPREYRTKFEAEHVNTFKRMIERNTPVPHEVVCITDDWRNLDSGIRVVPLWPDYAEVPSPHGGVNPACYRRLKAFSHDMLEIIGPRFVSMDLDVVITANIDHILTRKEDFIIWGDPQRQTRYNGSMWMMNAGARACIWEEFEPTLTPKLTLQRGFQGSDQAWISMRLPNEAEFTKKDGVYSWRTDFNDYGRHVLHKNACIVFFPGSTDPWSQRALRESPWVAEHYR